jgi:hypothetical protein
LELFKNGGGAAVASDTQTVGAGAASGATFAFSTVTANQHWAADDTISIGLTPANSLTPVVMIEIVAEFYVR